LRSASLAEVAGELLQACLSELLEHAQQIGLDSDPEHVHRARVATRKLRSDLRTLNAAFDPNWSQSLSDELRWLGESLGNVRDSQVMLARLTMRIEALPMEEQTAASGLSTRLAETVHSNTRELMVVLRSDRYECLLQLLRGPAVFKAEQFKPAVSVLAALTKAARRKLKRAVKALPADPADAQLHRVRIVAKRCRYAAEALALSGGRRAVELADACRSLQDVLGEHQDSVVMRRWLRELAPRVSPLEALSAGEIIGLEQTAAATARDRWPSAWVEVRHQRLG